MTEGKRQMGSWVLGGAVLITWLLAAPGALASPRDETLRALEAIESSWPDPGIEIRVERDADGPLRIGEEIVYRFTSARAGYLTALLVDTHGAPVLLFPRADAEQARIGPGAVVELPSADDGFSIEVQPPVGRDLIYAIVTREPLTRESIGVASLDVVVSLQPEDGPRLVRRIRAVLDSRDAGAVAVAHVSQQIDGRGDVVYRSADIVEFFGERTRSIRPPKLDLQIQFATDSAELDAVARKNVDEFALALEDPKLAETRFVIAGHTDDRGSDAHNLRLSRRRAEAVRRYLVSEGGIAAERLEIEAHGENAPLMAEESAFARAMNRRVEFSPVR